MGYLKEQAETLNDLVLINNDRVEGYKKLLMNSNRKITI